MCDSRMVRAQSVVTTLVSLLSLSQVGQLILAGAANTNLKRVTLELGGKSPNIIFPDVDCELLSASSVLSAASECCCDFDLLVLFCFWFAFYQNCWFL